MTHSKTPWRLVGNADGSYVVLGADGRYVLMIEMEHAVACVNAIGDMDPARLAAFIGAAMALRFEAAEYHDPPEEEKENCKICLFDRALRELRGK